MGRAVPDTGDCWTRTGSLENNYEPRNIAKHRDPQRDREHGRIMRWLAISDIAHANTKDIVEVGAIAITTSLSCLSTCLGSNGTIDAVTEGRTPCILNFPKIILRTQGFRNFQFPLPMESTL